uniref:Uncharacterized protein n=1 Tax=Anguilla anguilla TaxID=7936 RepID=A0A0E9SK81_ANGAN
MLKTAARPPPLLVSRGELK